MDPGSGEFLISVVEGLETAPLPLNFEAALSPNRKTNQSNQLPNV